MKGIQRMLTLHSYQGCSYVRNRCYIMHGFCFYHYFDFILLVPTLSEAIFLENKRETLLSKNICFPYNFSVPGFLLETWSFALKLRVCLKPWGTKIAEWTLLSPGSEDPSPLTALCTVCFHWLWTGRQCTLKWKPMDALMSGMNNLFSLHQDSFRSSALRT